MLLNRYKKVVKFKIWTKIDFKFYEKLYGFYNFIAAIMHPIMSINTVKAVLMGASFDYVEQKDAAHRDEIPQTASSLLTRLFDWIPWDRICPFARLPVSPLAR